MLAVLLLSLLFFGLGYLLTRLGNALPVDEASLTETVLDMLPQTQCGQCGFAGCRPYAEALVRDEVALNLCPPGGQQLVQQLAETLSKPAVQLEKSAETELLAVIIEDQCIGCTKCIQACPVDAIIGAAQYMHGVLTQECTGCELCVPVCPVDCIEMHTSRRAVWT